MSFRANQHHAKPRAILIQSTTNVEDLLVGVFLVGYGVLTTFRLNYFRCLGIIHRPSYFGCIR